MKKISMFLMALCTIWVAQANDPTPKNWFENFEYGDPEIKSINALAFGPEGILFIGDSKNAAVFAIATNDNQAVNSVEAIRLQNVDGKIAGYLGAKTEDIVVRDMAVNPVSKSVYLAVENVGGSPVLLKLAGESFENIDLTKVKYSSIGLENAVAEDAKDRRGRELRVWAISDLGFYGDKVMVSGLSNQEFGSTFRSIPFPFKDSQEYASLEIYHAAHGQYETHSPIKTFTVANVNGQDHLIASYTCTPLVLFPLSEIKTGQHVKGRTVAELGAGNSPLDIISMSKEGEDFLIMSNSNRPVMKVRYSDVENFESKLTEPIDEMGATGGVDFINLPAVNVLQMDKLDDSQFLVLQRTSSGDLIFRTIGSRWL